MRTSLRSLAFLILCLAGLGDPARSVAVPAPTFKSAEVVAEYGYRYYSAELGRWLNLDPLGELGSRNLYGFLSNDGLNRQDLLGCIEWQGYLDILKSGEIFRAGYRGARQGVGNVYKAGKGVVTAPSQFGATLGREIGDYLYLPDEFDARWADRLAMLDALVNDSCYRQQAIEALKKEFGDSIADGSLFANLSVDILSSLAGVGIAKQLDRLNELIKLGKLQKLQRTASMEASSALQGARLREHLRQLEKYGQAASKELENGRIRYYGDIEPATTPGTMAGRRLVREWDPSIGATRTWHETVDQAGRVRIVRPETGASKVHYRFDEHGNYIGSF